MQEAGLAHLLLHQELLCEQLLLQLLLLHCLELLELDLAPVVPTVSEKQEAICSGHRFRFVPAARPRHR